MFLSVGVFISCDDDDDEVIENTEDSDTEDSDTEDSDTEDSDTEDTENSGTLSFNSDGSLSIDIDGTQVSFVFDVSSLEAEGIDYSDAVINYTYDVSDDDTYNILFWIGAKEDSPYSLDSENKIVTIDYSEITNGSNGWGYYAQLLGVSLSEDKVENISLTNPFLKYTIHAGVTDLCLASVHWAESEGYFDEAGSIIYNENDAIFNIIDYYPLFIEYTFNIYTQLDFSSWTGEPQLGNRTDVLFPSVEFEEYKDGYTDSDEFQNQFGLYVHRSATIVSYLIMDDEEDVKCEFSHLTSGNSEAEELTFTLVPYIVPTFIKGGEYKSLLILYDDAFEQVDGGVVLETQTISFFKTKQQKYNIIRHMGVKNILQE